MAVASAALTNMKVGVTMFIDAIGLNLANYPLFNVSAVSFVERVFRGDFSTRHEYKVAAKKVAFSIVSGINYKFLSFASIPPSSALASAELQY
ncbi:hypothetical protein TanjilG_13029 [Lupinus angustifolius]|uniref:Uncharacterized protein n=1 Tax=Lupinus angustifolius TaxID=3871 RepID=A0A1J7HS07_LUPAN|nr:hypothetical protein TanjilG_13029 [Lupinus angustifolius]